MRHKGFLLVEMLIVVIVLPVVMVVIDQVFRQLSGDIPRSGELVSHQQLLGEIVEQIREDCQQGRSMTVAELDDPNESIQLQIEQSDQTITYVYNGTTMTRFREDRDSRDPTRDWYVPQAKIKWQAWPDPTNCQAVQLATHVHYRQKNKALLKNNHLCFLGRQQNKGGPHETN